MITNIQNYSKDELSLLVFNTERLYKLRNDANKLMIAIDSQFIYTDDQLKVLMADTLQDLIDSLITK